MTKPSARAEVNSFVKGLITEASPLNFPQNASADEVNFELNRDGTRNRRLGMDYEPDHTNIGTFVPMTSQTGLNTFKWLNVNGVAEEELLVVQNDRLLFFFDLNNTSVSSVGAVGTLLLSGFPASTTYSFTSVEGKLIIAAGVDTVCMVTYEGGIFTQEYQRLLTRDLWGIEVTLIPSYETDSSYRGALDYKHLYNLQNQSWGIPRKDKTGILSDPITLYNGQYSKFPSNSEVVWTGLQFQPVASGADPYERIYPSLYEEVLGLQTKAARGYFVIDVLRRGQSRSDVTLANNIKYPDLDYAGFSFPVDYTAGGARFVNEFAGRVWYSGFEGEVTGGDKRSPSLSNFVFFSQVVKNRGDFVKCYQEGDPTSRDNSDIVDTDGGFIRVSGAKNIIGMVSLGAAQIIIADNGVWAIEGGNEFGFSATNYKATKISTFGGLSSSSIVLEANRAFFWSEFGIFAIAPDQFGKLQVTNITETTIQTLYEQIPNTSKETAVGLYDASSKKVRWLYKTGTPFSSSSVTKELILDTVLTAFYQNEISTLASNQVEVMSMFAGTPFTRSQLFDPVVAGGVAVSSIGVSVGITEATALEGLQSTRYLVSRNIAGMYTFTFAYYNNTKFIDWESHDGIGVDAAAFVLTGETTAGDTSITKQMPYLIMHFKRTEAGVGIDLQPLKQSGCLMRCQWGFANTAAANKWTPLQEVYKYRKPQFVTGPSDPYDNGFAVVTTKTKVRGRGKAFALYLQTEPLKDCQILGWSIGINGTTIA